jgi:hypothetical protein
LLQKELPIMFAQSNGLASFEMLESRALFSAVVTPLPTISIVASDASACEVGDTHAAFTISSSAAPASDLLVKFSISGKASNGKDYVAIPKQAVILAGQTSATVPIDVIDDKVLELTEDVILTLKAGKTYAVDAAAKSARVVILDDELPTVSVKVKSANASETGKVATFVVSRNGPKTEALTVEFSLTGTAVNGEDYTQIQTIVIPVGKSSTTVTIAPIDDALAEGTETVILTVQNCRRHLAGVMASATATIADNDLDMLGGLPFGDTSSVGNRLKGTLSGAGSMDLKDDGKTQGVSFVAGNNSAGAYFKSDANGVYLTQTERYINWDYDCNLYLTPIQVLPAMMTLGQVYKYTGPFDGGTVTATSQFVKWENVVTSAGTVSAARVQITLSSAGAGWTNRDSITIWISNGIVKWSQASKNTTFGASSGYSFTATL